MPVRRLPVHPDIEQLRRQAKEFLRAIHAGDANALAELRQHSPEAGDASSVTLADAQRVLARSYKASSWTRLVQAVHLADAIWRDDAAEVTALITRNPDLIHEEVLIRRDSNWGPPMTYAANLGRDHLIRMLHDHGAKDHESAAGRAAIQGKPGTVRLVHKLAGRPLARGSLAGPAYTLSVEGTAIMFALGARVDGPGGVDTNTMEHLLGTDSRRPADKHRILEMYVEHGFEPPDTPVMALHRGRIDLLDNTSNVIRISSRARSTSPTSFPSLRPHGASRTPRRGRRYMGRRCCTSRPTSMSWRSRRGCSIAEWIRTPGARLTPTAVAVIPRCFRRWCHSATSGSTTARERRTKRGSRDFCWIAAPTRTSGRRCGTGWRKGTVAAPFACTET